MWRWFEPFKHDDSTIYFTIHLTRLPKLKRRKRIEQYVMSHNTFKSESYLTIMLSDNIGDIVCERE